VSDLIGKQRLDATVLQKGLQKVTKRISRWKILARRLVPGKEADWLSNVLLDYDPVRPASPTLVEGNHRRGINLLMTIDPSFGYSLRSAQSLGLMTEKTQVAVQGTRLAALLAFIGAARFLRAQRLSGALVNCYVPVARKLLIRADATLPMLLPADEKADQAALWHWLALSRKGAQPQAEWRGLAYQTLLTQGQRQSLCVGSGALECGWLMNVQERIGGGVPGFWQAQLSANEKGTRDEQEALLDCLKGRRADAWLAHLRALAQSIYAQEYTGRPYSLEEVRTITEAMNDAEHAPLKQVLQREEGTLRFGRALRQIGRSNPARLRDLLEELEEVQTHAQLLPVLHRVLLASEIEPVLRLDICLWPMITDYRHGAGKVLVRVPLLESAH
jgi:hypothetical protein